MNHLKFNYDPDRDILEIEGVLYSGELMREWGRLRWPEEKIVKIGKDSGGALTMWEHTCPGLDNEPRKS